MAIEFTQITKAGSSGSSSDNSILEWEQPVNTYIGMSMGSLSEATEILTEEMATKFKNNKYNIIVSTVDLGANTITVNCYLEVINKINDSEDIILQYSGNDSSGKAKVYFTIDTANLQVKYYLEQGGSSGGSSGSSVDVIELPITSYELPSENNIQDNITYMLDWTNLDNYISNSNGNIQSIDFGLYFEIEEEGEIYSGEYKINPSTSNIVYTGNQLMSLYLQTTIFNTMSYDSSNAIHPYNVYPNSQFDFYYNPTDHSDDKLYVQMGSITEISTGEWTLYTKVKLYITK